jgi:hypothetical protein
MKNTLGRAVLLFPGKSSRMPRGESNFPFSVLTNSLPKLEQFLGAMTGLSRINFEAFAAKFDFSNFKTICDIGGATGLLFIEVAKKHSYLRRTSFDLPPVEPIAQRHIAAAGLNDRIGTASGDFFKDPLPKGDIITMGMILHDWNLEKRCISFAPLTMPFRPAARSLPLKP